MSARTIEEDVVFKLNDDDLYPDVQLWARDRSANNWNLNGHTWGGIFPQDLDRLQNETKKVTPVKKVSPVIVAKK